MKLMVGRSDMEPREGQAQIHPHRCAAPSRTGPHCWAGARLRLRAISSIVIVYDELSYVLPVTPPVHITLPGECRRWCDRNSIAIFSLYRPTAVELLPCGPQSYMYRAARPMGNWKCKNETSRTKKASSEKEKHQQGSQKTRPGPPLAGGRLTPPGTKVSVLMCTHPPAAE